jgi:hypothetical protein
MLNKKEFLAEATKIIKEEIRGNLFLGYKVEIPGKMFNNSCFTIKAPDGLLKEYDISSIYARYRLTDTSVNNSIGELKETVLYDLKMLEEYKEFMNEKDNKADKYDKAYLADKADYITDMANEKDNDDVLEMD